jgi:mono/diheme cytochrome c family protein
MSMHSRHEREERSQPDVLPLHQAQMRELEDPRDGFAPTPVWLLFLCFGLVAWGGGYIAMHSGGWRHDMYDDDPAALVQPREKPKPLDPMVLGARTFNNCTQCHQADAKGVPGTYPPLAGSEWVRGNPEVLVRILLNGAEGDLTVLGNRYNGQMPSWSRLSDEQIAAVATYIRNSFGNKEAAIDPALVTEMRKQFGSRPGPWHEAELK